MTRRLAPLLAVLAAGALAACGGGGQEQAAVVPATGPPDAQVVTVFGTDGLDFEPAAVSARPGALTLTLENKGGTPHDLVFADKALPSISAVSGGQRKAARYTFTAAGTYDFVCSYHPGMDGQVVIG